MRTVRKITALFTVLTLTVAALFCFAATACADDFDAARGGYNDDGNYELTFPTVTEYDLRYMEGELRKGDIKGVCTLTLFTDGNNFSSNECCGFLIIYGIEGDVFIPVTVSQSIITVYADNMAFKANSEKIFTTMETTKTSSGKYGARIVIDGEAAEDSKFFGLLKNKKNAYTALFVYDGEKFYAMYSEEPSFGYVTSYISFEKHGTGAEPAKQISIGNMSFSPISDRYYTGNAITPSITVKSGSKTLKENTDYTVSYSNNKDIGTATVKITGINAYFSSKSITFRILPKKTALTAKKSNGKYKLSWKAAAGIDKYQIQYSDDGGKTYKTAGRVSAGKTSTTLKLDASKNYTFRIRSYKTVDGKNYYSAWSKAVSAK
ncbi:MAG: fibronectin type III domain-containing protein [Ruminiclostridium sp.]|nr:fibronectin type III domain-containing protein [Ruminiclostridium sp.]